MISIIRLSTRVFGAHTPSKGTVIGGGYLIFFLGAHTHIKRDCHRRRIPGIRPHQRPCAFFLSAPRTPPLCHASSQRVPPHCAMHAPPLGKIPQMRTALFFSAQPLKRFLDEALLKNKFNFSPQNFFPHLANALAEIYPLRFSRRCCWLRNSPIFFS